MKKDMKRRKIHNKEKLKKKPNMKKRPNLKKRLITRTYQIDLKELENNQLTWTTTSCLQHTACLQTPTQKPSMKL